MGNAIAIPEGYTAHISGNSSSTSEKDAIIVIADNGQAAETFYLYGKGDGSLQPRPDLPPVTVKGAKDRAAWLVVKNTPPGGKQVTSTWVDQVVIKKDQNSPLPADTEFHFVFYADKPGDSPSDTVLYAVVSKNQVGHH
ncbi:hypothetical protein DXG01_007328 [Tephrocybe rancida]|nr:hypothetical protein DXG01_007328 [Tephrocybe rancida]